MARGRGWMGKVDSELFSAGGWVQRALTRWYERRGMAGLLLPGLATLISAATLGLVLLGFVTVTYGLLSARQAVRYVVLSEAMATAALLIGLVASRRSLRILLSWKGPGRTQEGAVEVWRAGITAPRQAVARTCIATLPLASVMVALWLADFDKPAWIFVPVVIALGVLLAAAGVIVALGVEFVLRPVVRDIAAHLPSDVAPVVSTLPLRTKISIPLPGVILTAVVVAGGFIEYSEDDTARFMTSLGLGLAGAFMAGTAFLLLTRAAFDPIDELTDATERVREGDLTTPVPVVSADELGTLAMSFNQMLEGLREREALREHNAALLEDVRASRARIVATADAERRRMERDLHDSAQQRLTLIKLKLALAAELVRTDADAAEQALRELTADAEKAVDELRDLAHGIYPPMLETHGLTGALEDVVYRSRLPVSVSTDGIGRYPARVEAAVYFCCLEAVQNATKHAGDGSLVRIDLEERDGRLLFTVTDDGRGFDPADTGRGVGLQNMTDRIGALGGTVRIDAAPGRGTVVAGTVPLAG